jgi:lon-related putative ATP-dependent protease
MEKAPMTEKTKSQPASLSALPIKALRTVCDPALLGFDSTDELKPMDDLIGQERALGAISFGASIDQPGYNLFVLGPQGTGRHTAISSYLKGKAANEPAPDDWIYVHNFKEAHRPQALRLPGGTAMPFKSSMSELVEDLRAALRRQFTSDEYREKRQAIDAEFEEMQSHAFEELQQKAEKDNIAIIRTPMGFTLAPVEDGKVIKPDDYNKLDEGKQKQIEEKIEKLQNELAAVIEKLPRLEKQHRDKVRNLYAAMTGTIVDAAIKIVTDRFSTIETIQKRLVEIKKDLVENAGLFLFSDEKLEQETSGQSSFDQAERQAMNDQRLNRYLVNVIVTGDEDGDKKGAPLVLEDHPTLSNLVGRIEHRSQFGALMTDFTMIRPGALHRANGGYLVIDARRLLSEPFSWEALKRTLRSGSISIESAGEQLGFVSTVSLQPEHIPLKLKVVLIGERQLYYLLSTLDPDFTELFKVEVDFDEELQRSNENTDLYARLIGSILKKEKLKAMSAKGVARVIDETARLAADSERLSLRISLLSDLLRESDFWAEQAGNELVCADDVERAVTEQIHRSDRIRQRSHEMIERGTILIDTDGEKIGQLNGLSVLAIGNFAFGSPSRISARTRMGSGKLVDIERESKLGGSLHSKGVLILSSFLAANYALDAPMSLWASIVFEQSYGGVDGDSASSAELYTLLSSLSNAPLKQSLAVTGSVNQHGQVQAIGGVNEKIEGFFDICKAQGLTGRQGVLIPASNVKHLMLRPDVVEAASKGKFHIYPVETIAEGIELLTGVSAGVRGEDGTFPKDSINGRVEARLIEFARTRKNFGKDKDKENNRSDNSGEIA